MIRLPPSSTLFPSPPLFRSVNPVVLRQQLVVRSRLREPPLLDHEQPRRAPERRQAVRDREHRAPGDEPLERLLNLPLDRKSTRLNSSHANISYAVFCLEKKK